MYQSKHKLKGGKGFSNHCILSLFAANAASQAN